MARKGMAGQLNMFDFFNQDVPSGEVEMVSLMPNFEEEESVLEVEEVPEPVVEEMPSEPEVEEESDPVKEEMPSEPEVEEESEPVKEERTEQEDVVSSHRIEMENAVMSRVYEIDGEKLEIAYLNYNKVRITKGNKEPEIKVFDSSKEAVDYYVEKMQELEVDE